MNIIFKFKPSKKVLLPHIKAFKNCKNMKNLLLFSTLLLTSVGAMAQLTVKPNGTADSYVYVNNEVLYVAQDVNLTPNPTAATEASIYLRNNAQLIQSGATSSNTGDGFLSVQQNTPVTNSWAYYYWCSPVGNPAATQAMTYGNNKNFGLRSMYEDTNAVPGIGTSARQTTLITGDNGYTNPALTISKRWVYTHEVPGTEAGEDYNRLNGSNYALPGWGFTMKGVNVGTAPAPGDPGSNHDQLYEFRGRPNSGSFTIDMGNGLMTLSGNPYPSALDLNKLYWDLPDNQELGTFWYYDEDRTVTGSHNYNGKPYGYGVYTPGLEDTDGDPYDGDNMGSYAAAPFYIYKEDGTTVGTSTGPGGADQNKRFAPVGQGIMFMGDANGPITIKNSHRVFFKEGVLPGSIFQRPEGENNTTENDLSGPTLSTSTTPQTVDYRPAQLRLYAIFDRALTRDLLLTFYDQATDGYDRGLDGRSPRDLKADAYFPVGNDNEPKLPYVINAVNYDVNKQIPFAFTLDKQTDIELRVKEEVKKPYQHVYLYDSQENTYKALAINGARVTLTLPEGVYENRFFIVFRSPYIKLDTPKTEVERTELVRANVTFFQNNPQHQLEIRNPEGYTIKTASVYDMSGKLVISEKNLGDDNKYSFYTGNLSDGVYLVKLMTSDDVSIDYKAIVHNQ
ncbi:hypothetical protein A7A78_12550 [Aequorivita soesokkakensis]|uniref:Secretion system C-terminal sorting domain-containing protein n=2 Tax=Aequorivita soesokkakensis TaxID=1385699 RepID=A0A1A9LEV6_9FLAO|nr:hypothetical protein A7A78_12550 [Aequorivita soesokkakensis]